MALLSDPGMTVAKLLASVRKKYGPASKNVCATRSCTEWAYDWVNVTGVRSDSRGDYKPMCRSCRVKFDNVRINAHKS